MTTAPLVSVYIPTRNRAGLLARAVNSVLGQDYPNVELIIVDDCSTDETSAYLKDLATRFSRVRYLVNELQVGACASRNRAIAASTGTFITGLDDDDFFLPDHVSHFMAKADRLSRSSTVALFPLDYRIKTGGEHRLNKRKPQVKQWDLLDGNHVGNQVFTRLETLREAGGFDERMAAWQDIDLWYRMLKEPGSRMECTGAATYVFDVAHGQGRISDRNHATVAQAFEYFVEKHHLSPQERRVLSFQLCFYTRELPPISVTWEKLKRNPSRENLRQCWHVHGDGLLRKLDL